MLRNTSIRRFAVLAVSCAALLFGPGTIALRAQSIATTLIPSSPLMTPSTAIAAANLDGNARADIVVAFVDPYYFAPTMLVAAYLDPGVNPVATLGASLPLSVVSIFDLPDVTFVQTLRVGDLNGDSLSDLFLETIDFLGSYRIHAFLNTGNASFAPPVLLATFASANFRWAIGNFDGQNFDDELLVLTTSSLNVIDGTGVVLAGYSPPTGVFISAEIVVDDWNGDGADDAILPQLVTPPAIGSYFVGGPISSSGLNPLPLGFSPPTLPLCVTGSDVDADGIHDLLIQSLATPGTFSVYRGSSTGLLPVVYPPMTALTIGPGIYFGLPFLADFDRDQRPELIALHFPSGALTTGTIDLTFGHLDSASIPLSFASVARPIPGTTGSSGGLYQRRALDDFDGDGDLDLIFVRTPSTALPNAAFLWVENRTIEGSACGGSSGAPTLSLGSSWLQNQNFGISVSGGPPNAFGVLLVSLAAASASGCILVDIGPQNLVTVNGNLATFGTDLNSNFSMSVDLTGFPALSGIDLWMQAVVLDPTSSFSIGGIGLATSSARSVDFY